MHRHIFSSQFGITPELRGWARYLKHETHQTVVLKPPTLPVADRTTQRAQIAAQIHFHAVTRIGPAGKHAAKKKGAV
jgi:hypothetical protein